MKPGVEWPQKRTYRILGNSADIFCVLLPQVLEIHRRLAGAIWRFYIRILDTVKNAVAFFARMDVHKSEFCILLTAFNGYNIKKNFVYVIDLSCLRKFVIC